MKALSKLITGNLRRAPAVRGDNRSWVVAILVAALLSTWSVSMSAVINPLFGRYVHWNPMAVLAPALVFVTVGSVRRREA